MQARSDDVPCPGDILGGKYVLRKRIGAGGMGVVFLADHPALAQRIAVKVLHPHLARQESYARRFRNEALAASRMRHPGTAEVIDFDVATDGTPYIAMKLIPGRPLGQLLAERAIPLRRALRIFDQILKALDAAHACSVIHADVKSDNFMIEQTAGGEVVTMIDFGLAQLDGACVTQGVIVGTPEYMAPELIRGAAPTAASDLYGAGVILYELLTGATPFTGDSLDEILRRQLRDAVVPPSQRRLDRDIPGVLDEIVLRALAKDPRARFASARAFRAALEAGVRALDVSVDRDADAPAVRTAPPSWHRIARGSDAGDTGRNSLQRMLDNALVRGGSLTIAYES
jgi:serine/threonine protein kinase